MSTWPLVRGQVIQADIGLDEPKLLVVVSNNRRNERLGSVLCARMTTTAKPDLPSIVPLEHPEVFVGCVVCDDIVEVFEDEVMAVRGGLSGAAIPVLNDALRAALDIP
ncbi:type II toxin-antitoxin system PemK/MazF family toxin [Nocardioides sp. QY071]|uniref:type II toxin-antitoxin system PemK/MazF family toxin n=1 Tax=Nocardioides sp. QY071 TaxID=3044187 RepID=UPI00249C7F13|nr:type II toxin-antitoxin system PemK/MazF family toxin [Nocardioides sp. QY071]WGY04332.1 type II toxin-antitoxin system PemK/MazF family toxin [Nocardioides sp. QY071]